MKPIIVVLDPWEINFPLIMKRTIWRLLGLFSHDYHEKDYMVTIRSFFDINMTRTT
jgi:hypothetical protein